MGYGKENPSPLMRAGGAGRLRAEGPPAPQQSWGAAPAPRGKRPAPPARIRGDGFKQSSPSQISILNPFIYFLSQCLSR